VRQLALARVQPGTEVDVERAGRVDHGHRATDGSGRAVEGREHPVACAADRSAPVHGDVVLDEAIVVSDQGVPAPVPEPSCVLGGADDVGEHDRGQDPVRIVYAA
jgi:hypothetical protein